MVNEIIFIVEEEPVDGGYTAKALDYAIFTQADTIDQLHKMVKDAVNCHFDPNEKPKIIRLQFIKEEIISA